MRRIFFNDRDLPFTFLRKGEGFTLIESMVILSIIAILSIAMLPSYKTAKENLALHRSASMLAQDIRLVIEKAMSTQDVGCTHGGNKYGYGISLKNETGDEEDLKKYILFADCDGNKVKEPGQDMLFPKRFEDGIEIKGLSRPNLNIIFEPPDPTVFIKDIGGNEHTTAWITIGIIGEASGPTKTITVNKAGLIDID